MVAKLMFMAIGLAFVAAPMSAAATSTENQAIVRKIPDGPPSAMTNAAIAQHNEGLEPAHPDYIKCRKQSVIGSLAKKTRVCRTNEGWAQSWQQGNQTARDNADHFAPKFSDCRNSGSC